MNLRSQRQFSSKDPRFSRGVALVITLILLAVIATLAIAFLGLTHRETGAVDAMSRTTDAELSADSGLERAKAEILASFRNANFQNTGPDILGPEMIVSVCRDTNRIAPATLEVDASPPVFVDTNRVTPLLLPDSRFFLDLNRNLTFEETGYVGVTDNNLQPILGLTNWLYGDPQWIGVLQDPRLPHADTNRFIGRYAFMVLPAGRSLDVNWIHNDAKNVNAGVGNTGYFRNQGIGSYEMNMAAFLADLNTNMWNPAGSPFNFNADPSPIAPSSGVAFQDAFDFLRFRYMGPKANWVAGLSAMPSFENYLGDSGASVVPQGNDLLDLYSDGPVGYLGSLPTVDDDQTTRKYWPGTSSKTNLFTLHDFMASKSPYLAGFESRLKAASDAGNSYDRYTFYRMLSQMGTDSIPESEEDGKIDINYVNIKSWWPNSSDRLRTTDFVSWTNSTPAFIARMGRPGPELFLLTVATNLLLREPKLAFMVTDAPFGIPLRIPIFTNGSTINTNDANGRIRGPLYSGRVHQILQLAANIYDATTGPKLGEAFPYLPTVFRPQFEQANNGNVYITNYVLVTETANVIMGRVWHDLDANEGFGSVLPDHGVYGIPLIVAARKGHPNFNEFGFITEVNVTRRLEFRRVSDGAALTTNQTFTITITNQAAVEARNSYVNPNPRPIDLYFGMRSRTVVTNSTTVFPSTNWVTGYATSYQARAWGGEGSANALKFKITPTMQQLVLNHERKSAPDAGGVTNRWGMAVTNRMLFFLVDRDTARIVDAVCLNGPRRFFDIATELGSELRDSSGRTIANIWNNKQASSPNNGMSIGVANQISISTGESAVSDNDWRDYDATAGSKKNSTGNFKDFLDSAGTRLAGTNQAPFTPMRVMVQTNYYRVNDPLVHYTVEDLYPSFGTETVRARNLSARQLHLANRNPEAVSWNAGKSDSPAGSPGLGETDPTLRDPGMWGSDNWDFPTNQFPNIGWLGRVHRGTPWQTIYLKSGLPGKGNWARYSSPTRFGESAELMVPTRDWELLDIFTAAPHPNATRGRLSVNQTNLAAWSAVLSGVEVTQPAYDGASIIQTNFIVEPSAIDGLVNEVVTGINRSRTNQPNRQFRTLGAFLSVPELTYRSPFLNNSLFNAQTPTGMEQIFDSDYERLPQQIMSLLKVGEPRFVIYAWGQSLKPARFGVDSSSNPLRLDGPSIDPGSKVCNNYQVTGEVGTRAVVRVVFPERLANGRTNYRKPRVVVESFNIIPIE